MKPMLPTLTFDVPDGNEWSYEVKYDGFRAFLEWDQEIKLTSRNGNSLLPIFPEIKEFLLSNSKEFKPFLPLSLDGELVVLENPFKANFGEIQVRGRMRSQHRIEEKAKATPCRLMVFDVLQLEGKSLLQEPYIERRKILKDFFSTLDFSDIPNEKTTQLIQLTPSFLDFKKLWENVVLYDGEGIVAKREGSRWEEGKRSTYWLKYKNWKYVNCFILAYDKNNGYFFLGVFEEKKIQQIGSFIFGLNPDEKQALFQIIKQNKTNEDETFLYVKPAICVEIKYLELYEGQLREPHFHKFRFDLTPEQCTFDKFSAQQKNLPIEVEITHPEKPIWETPLIKKNEYIHYLREIAPYFLPFLNNRVLTVIRYPHGLFGEAFYQKNCPDYAPDFVRTHVEEGINYIVCNDLKTLLWLGNQIAIEFHIPFQTIHSKGPSEIVFDLDPPSKDAFPLAIKAARMIKEILDQLRLIGFIKTSGNKGLQVYIPLPENKYSYDDTRLFTSFVAEYLISRDPDSFTIERLKKNRGNRLYVDYVQHSEGKTIIAPYSPRGNKQATIAAPLFWEEVNESLTMESFKVTNMLKRLIEKGCPFKDYFKTKDIQNFDPVLSFLDQNKKH